MSEGPEPAPARARAPPEDPAGDAADAAERLKHLVRGPFGDVLPLGEGPFGRYTVQDQWEDLVRIPQNPRKVFNWRHVLALAKRTSDFFGHRRGWFGSWLNRVNPYPEPFLRVDIPSSDGTLIRGWLGLQPTRRPGVVIVPGMFSSKDDTVHKGKAIRIWRRWNYNVLIIDLRGFGLSGGSPNTPGWKEAEDVLAAARFLDSFNNVGKVGVIAESLGATASLLAAAQEGLWEQEALARLEGIAVPIRDPGGRSESDQGWHLPGADPALPPEGFEGETGEEQEAARVRIPRRVIAAVLAFSPFSEPRAAVERINSLPPRRDPFYHAQRLFIRLLSLHTQGRHRDFLEYMEASAEHYGVSLETLYRRSALLDAVHLIRCPTLIVHAEDDATVPVDQAQALQERVRDRDDVQVWILPWGRHVEWDLLDHRWYWRAVSRFMGQWVGR